MQDIIRSATRRRDRARVRAGGYDYISTPLDQQSVLDSQFTMRSCACHTTPSSGIYTTLSSLMDIYRERVLENPGVWMKA